MCGIAGFIESTPTGREDLHGRAQAMGNAISHRGPDDSGVWIDDTSGVALSHRRLSIIDLSPLGHQPMVSESGRFVIVFNGEIYNFQRMRSALHSMYSNLEWRGGSDTEVLLTAFERLGFLKTLEAANGMFAIAVYDRDESCLWLARDRMGEKPLYYGWNNGRFLFASEIAALESHPEFKGKLDSRSISLYLRFGYIPAPASIYQGISKLEPGTALRVDVSGAERIQQKAERYWQIPEPRATEGGDAVERIAALDSLVRDAVKLRMHSDVPLGAFLSGGVDSSLISAVMQAQSGAPIRTFSIGFSDQRFDESVFGRNVAQVIGSEHTELIVTASDALNVIPSMPTVYDEPFADSSQIPTYLLAKLTRKHVTVALSGDGGDELFGGYHRYFQGKKLLRMYRLAPARLRAAVGRALARIPPAAIERLLSVAPAKISALGSDRIYKFAEVVGRSGAMDLYKRLVSQWPDPGLIFPGTIEPPTLVDDINVYSRFDSDISWMMFVDQLTYLPDDILVKVDRASMAVGLEARVPLLDHRLVEFAAGVPEGMKMKGSDGKWLLRQVLHKYVDPSHFNRAKQGFGIPVADWLRGPLREWAESLLSETAIRRTGMLDARRVRDVWKAHLSGRQNFHYRLWVVLMLQAWMEHRRLAL